VNSILEHLPTLALLYKAARDANSTSNKHMLLRKLGNSALFMDTWFSHACRWKEVHKDGFIGMGSAAYDYLADYDGFLIKIF
jgi:hypothetical protein